MIWELYVGLCEPYTLQMFTVLNTNYSSTSSFFQVVSWMSLYTFSHRVHNISTTQPVSLQGNKLSRSILVIVIYITTKLKVWKTTRQTACRQEKQIISVWQISVNVNDTSIHTKVTLLKRMKTMSKLYASVSWIWDNTFIFTHYAC